MREVEPREREPVYEIVDPSPSAMIECLRAVGYSLATAIADLVDNSISAEARNVWIDFEWDGGKSFVSIADDGHGMDSAELVVALTLGSKSPLEARDSKDLGRFGLGLKTASFSQCRRMVVRSRRRDAGWSAGIWDLDYVSKWGEWRLLRECIESEEQHFNEIESLSHGTIVLWSKLDRIVDRYNLNHRLFCSSAQLTGTGIMRVTE